MTEKLYSEKFRFFDENYKIIKDKVEKAAFKSKRKMEDISILAATKTVDVELINHAIQSGIKHIGENRVQEFLSKYDELDKNSVDCQFIGRLQTNKVKYIVDKVSCIQSVDSVKLAKEISRISTKENINMNILIEVNVGSEESKGGISYSQLYEFIDEVRQFNNIFIQGLMTIPPISDENSQLSAYFDKMYQYYVDIQGKKLDNVDMNYLSMGMSSDYELAIEHGANMVRIGSSLFGKRI